MRLLFITGLSLALNFIGTNTVREAFNVTSSNTHSGNANKPVAVANNILYQSTDGGQTWEDVSFSLPATQLPEGFFAGESELYVRVNNGMYRSKSNLKAPVWEKVQGLDPKSNAIAFNRSGVMAYSFDGHIYRKKPSSETWSPVYTSLQSTSLKPHEVAAIFETSDGSIFLSTGKSLSKSSDHAQTWTLVQNGFVGDMVESDGVLLATGQQGIMRSTDKGEHWDWVIQEGGVGIDVERIEGGFAAISYNTATQSRRIRISMDHGTTWQAIDSGLPPSLTVSSIKQVGPYLLCAHPDGIFRSSDKGKTWYRMLEGVEKDKIRISTSWNTNPLPDNRKVFQLFVSGKVVYAVAQEGGC